MIIIRAKKYRLMRKGIGVFYKEKGGGLVLRDETAWYKIAGFWINTERGCTWYQFRRIDDFNRYLAKKGIQ